MKVVILAGGFGTRISEESRLKPKPMIKIGDKPIIWHIMKLYSYYGFNDFIVCAGYKQNVIKEWFANYYLNNSDITFDYTNGGNITVHKYVAEPWKVTIADTGLDTMTGGRIKRVKNYIGNEPFFMTYGDGVSNVNIKDLLSYHKAHGKLATMTIVRPEGRFGVVDINSEGQIKSFREKNKSDACWINGGFMVLEPEVIDYISDDTVIFEREPLEKIAENGQLMSYKHNGFWHCMDTMNDKEKLDKMWEKEIADWKVW